MSHRIRNRRFRVFAGMPRRGRRIEEKVQLFRSFRQGQFVWQIRVNKKTVMGMEEYKLREPIPMIMEFKIGDKVLVAHFKTELGEGEELLRAAQNLFRPAFLRLFQKKGIKGIVGATRNYRVANFLSRHYGFSFTNTINPEKHPLTAPILQKDHERGKSNPNIPQEFRNGEFLLPYVSFWTYRKLNQRLLSLLRTIRRSDDENARRTLAEMQKK